MANVQQRADPQDEVGQVDVDELEHAASKRAHRRWERVLFYWLCAGFTAFHLIILTGPVILRTIDDAIGTGLYRFFPINIDQELFRAIHLAWGAVLGFGFFAIARGRGRDGVPWYDWLFIAGATACAVYMWRNLDDLQMNQGAVYETPDLLYSLVGLAVVFEFTRRTAGNALTIIATVFMLYAVLGHWLPEPLHHDKSLKDLWFAFPYIYSNLGIFGPTLEVSSTFIIMFTAFAAFLTRSKAGDYFNDLAVALVGWARGGPAKVAVLSGVMFGSISGSSVANVVASGSVTIPMMRRVGYDRATAGAIEATSSTGGQITPPVLGAAAFLMAEATGIKYAEIAFAAIIPCFLFYVACYMHCDLHAAKRGLRGLPMAELPRLGPMMARFYMLAPIVVLVWAFTEGYSAFLAAGLGMLACIVVSWFNGIARDDDGRWRWRRSDAVMGWRAVIDALELGAKDSIQLVAVCAAAGIVVGVIALTGIGGRFAYIMQSIAGNSQLLAMFFTMIVVTILGMGMPTTAAYAIAAAVVAPGLVQIGVPKLTAHMFIFYYAVLSAITPPVAVASIAAAGMAKADAWKTSWIAVKLGLATFIVPFMFFYSPTLLGQGDWLEIAQPLLSATVGVCLLACATEGWLGGALALPLRVVLFVGALCLIAPEPISDGVGLAIGLGVWALQKFRPPVVPRKA
ncbi:TRAP transporter permease [Vineibacter terrae]|uniref:TRAP transporter permease n=1 Tax=Vineibacter terrae TaxID=2586908 RepID=A0A5C8PEK1_9HYPH|nr:TRAP transporter permease [Vineibacter terrae]TXL72219.1 TRAP transporter permease [Vineibacter terrae]